jgi:hypothetical protein
MLMSAGPHGPVGARSSSVLSRLRVSLPCGIKESSWSFEWLLAAAAVWLCLVITWPVIDAAIVIGVWRGRHPTPLEATRIEPLVRRLATGMGLGWMPWIAVGSGTSAENGIGASSVVIIGETAIANWSDDALSGLIAHVVLEHGRIAPSVALAIIALLTNLECVITHTGPFEAGPFVFAGIGAVVWMVALLLVAGPTLFPSEVARDKLAVKRGYGRELRAAVQSFPRPPLPPTQDPLDRFIRWGYRTHPTPEQRLRAH